MGGRYETRDGATFWVEEGKAPVPVASVGTHERNRGDQSHADFFKRAGERQKVRRTALVADQMQRLLTPNDTTVVAKKTISDADMLELLSHPERWAVEHFTPFSQYGDKALKYRAMIPGEVGLVEKPDGEAYYLVLEEPESRVFAVEMDMTKGTGDAGSQDNDQ